MSRLKQLIHEVHRRSLWQVLGIYVIGGWLVLQAVDTLAGALNLPEWAPPLALFLLIIGLPIVLATAFVQEGIRDRTVVDGEPDRTVGGTPIPGTGAADQAAGRHFFTWRNALMGGVGAFAMLGLVSAAWLVFGARDGSDQEAAASGVEVSTAATDARASIFVASVAVLPFDNMGEADDEFLSDGITEEIIAQLAQVPGLKVISRTSVVALKGSPLTLPQIADTLGVDHVLEGSVRRAGEEARITVQLIEAGSDAHLWAESYTRELLDLFDLQEEIAREVTEALVERVPRLRSAAPGSRTESTVAYEEYLRGRQQLHQRTRESLLGAMAAFERAASVDSSYAPPLAGRSSALGLWPHYGYQGGPDHYTAVAEAIALADRAIAIDPELADAYAARGFALTHAWAPSEEVIADFSRALELQPNSADIHGWYAHILTRDGDFELALEEAQRAIDLDPIAPGRRVGFATDALGAGRYDLVIREAQHARLIQPTIQLPLAWKGIALMLLDRADECLEFELNSFPWVTAMCLHAVGRVEEADGMIEAMIDEYRSEGERRVTKAALTAGLAIYYARTGARDAMFEWLQQAFDESPHGVDFRYIQSGLFDAVRDDPEFQSRYRELREAAWQRVERMSRGTG